MCQVYSWPKNQEIWVQSEHTKQVADLLAQSKPKKLATDVFSWALLVQKYVLPQIGHLSWCPFTAIVSGSDFLNRFIIKYLD